MPYRPLEGKMEIKVIVPVLEVDLAPVEDVDIVITNHPMRRDYVVIQKGDVSLTVSPSDIERAIQAAKLAHRI
jgi:hypothetical protein